MANVCKEGTHSLLCSEAHREHSNEANDFHEGAFWLRSEGRSFFII